MDDEAIDHTHAKLAEYSSLLLSSRQQPSSISMQEYVAPNYYWKAQLHHWEKCMIRRIGWSLKCAELTDSFQYPPAHYLGLIISLNSRWRSRIGISSSIPIPCMLPCCLWRRGYSGRNAEYRSKPEEADKIGKDNDVKQWRWWDHHVNKLFNATW